MASPRPARVLVHRIALHSQTGKLKNRHLLSAEECARAERFRQASDHDAYVVTRITLRRILAHHLKVEARAVEFAYGPQDKPMLREGTRIGLHFNVTHTNGLALIAVAEAPVGIDLEFRRNIPDLAEIAASQFAPDEIAVLQAAARHERNELFLRCWTRKEAFAKATGDGIDSKLRRFVVSLTREEPALLQLHDRPGESPRDYAMAHLEPAPDYLGALVVAAPALRWRYAAREDDSFR